jgi:phage shock protein PspC (stress-responsive transcriptional regulator)
MLSQTLICVKGRKLSSYITQLFLLPEQSDTPFILLLSFRGCASLMVIFYEIMTLTLPYASTVHREWRRQWKGVGL